MPRVCKTCIDKVQEYKDKSERYCQTPECVQVAASILENIDLSVNPCDDFWEYSCGGWHARSEIPAEMDSWGVDNELIKKVRRKIRHILESPIERNESNSAERKFKLFYQKCMDVENVDSLGLTPFIDMVDEFGGWALLGM